MTEVTITTLPAAPLHVFEIWGNAAAVAKRFKAVTGFALPATGRSGGNDALRLIRFEPTVWLVEGDASALSAILSDDGAVTAIGGGFVRLHVIDETTCDAYVPLSFSQGLLHFWTQAAGSLAG